MGAKTCPTFGSRWVSEHVDPVGKGFGLGDQKPNNFTNQIRPPFRLEWIDLAVGVLLQKWPRHFRCLEAHCGKEYWVSELWFHALSVVIWWDFSWVVAPNHIRRCVSFEDTMDRIRRLVRCVVQKGLQIWTCLAMWCALWLLRIGMLSNCRLHFCHHFFFFCKPSMNACYILLLSVGSPVGRGFFVNNNLASNNQLVAHFLAKKPRHFYFSRPVSSCF